VSATEVIARLDPQRWLLRPAALSLAATLIFGAPLEALGLRLPEPVFPLVLAFSWAVIRPSVLAPFLLLALGLFQDLLTGGPPGLWPLALLTAYALTVSARRALSGQSGLTLFAAYAATVIVDLGVATLALWAAEGEGPGLVDLLWQGLATLVLFVFAVRLIGAYEDADVRFR
jgi:rod shape-determining protein MreD